ncbi:uncharacterized protein LOC8086487 isoform X3 [Sorghum bicolor]|jgi:hypothetical protein|uniref:uncharacterized protein LOC8086487 isoform X3 n=1 Tax=Sorghum bicolor TaxID=4558 RepID=UPI0001A86C37|nr:uncharacterized protein LOC8086487 isoform X3 [Sorghum bicolor]|eukprot:XP_002446250.1 uncharacterized protein LOC8086487 isoform X3 [Sorghum bicolor]
MPTVSIGLQHVVLDLGVRGALLSAQGGEDPLVSMLRTQLGIIHPLSAPPVSRSVVGLFTLFFFVGAAFDKLQPVIDEVAREAARAAAAVVRERETAPGAAGQAWQEVQPAAAACQAGAGERAEAAAEAGERAEAAEEPAAASSSVSASIPSP